ncbi:hypothetical protein AAGG74_17810 [Bacillus mexicanus]|uniref:hypothetical protein n=1 Tax=Bacillus mexicanus TaxID=2834415 RepID=UPI003D1D4A26
MQMNMFPSEKQEKEQAKLLQELITLKSSVIEENEFKNFFGTVEDINQKKIEVNKKIETFKCKVKKTFPNLSIN